MKNFYKIKVMMLICFFIGHSAFAYVTVDGFYYFEGASDHSDTKVLFAALGLIRHVSTSGSDNSGDGSESNPFVTIQYAINSSTDGDTVLVQPGTYVENINFNGKNIVVGSLFLTTQDTSYIYSTIIDGNQSGSVVTFENGEDSTAVLNGFIITNGNGTYAERPEGGLYFYYGGGIYCAYSSPTLEYINVYANTVENFGAGFYCHSSSPHLSNILFSNNSAGTNGGGIKCEYSSRLYLKNVDIIDNNAVSYSGGIYISDSEVDLDSMLISNNIASQGGGFYAQNSMINFNRVVITNNTASDVSNYNIGAGIYLNNVIAQLINSTIYGNLADDYGGGAYLFRNTELSIINSIFWNNSPNEIWSPEYGDSNIINISYTDIFGGLYGITTNNNCTVNWLDGNIDDNPLFVDEANNNFHLSDYSPCIDAGNPDSVYYDPDGTIADIGAFYYDQGGSGINEIAIHDINIYPNPAKENITIQSTEIIKRVEIINCVGQKMYNKIHIEDLIKINIKDFVDGIYIIRIENGNKVVNKKIIIE